MCGAGRVRVWDYVPETPDPHDYDWLSEGTL